jgi:hypothetical protein
MAQAPPVPCAPLVVPTLAKAPAMDRSADLSDWVGALRITEFGNWYPVDKGKPKVETLAYLAWGPDGLYVAVEAHDPDPKAVRAFPSRRDNINGGQDLITVDLDATGKGQSSVSLSCNALGVQADAMQTPNSWSSTYDLLWDSMGMRTSYGYLVKFRIPFTSLRRLPGDWGIRISRYHSNGRGYTMAWPQQSQDNSCNLCQLAKITGAPVTNGGAPFLVIPTLTAHRTESASDGTLGHPRQELRPGMDLRYSGTALTVDATYRPDFSAVEADIDPLILNSRFKYQFPEKRPFFQEGLEVFAVNGAQKQFASRSLLEPEYGVKATGRMDWGTWGALQVQDLAGGASLASDGASLPSNLQTRDSALAAHLDTDAKGSSLTFMGTNAQVLGGEGTYTGRSGGVYLAQRFGEHLQVNLNRIESWTRLPNADAQVTSEHGSATHWGVDWGARNGWVSAGGNATSPDLILANGFVDLTGYKSQWAGSGFTFRSDKAWWSSFGGGVNYSKLDWWNGDPMSKSGSIYGSLSTRIRLNVYASLGAHGREWAQGQEVETRSYYFNINFSRYPWLRPSLVVSGGRGADYNTGLPAITASRQLNLYGNFLGFSYSVQGALNQLRDEASDNQILRAQRVYGNAEYAFPLDFYLRVQSQITRYEAPDQDPTQSRFIQLLAGWQPNAFTQVYLGYSQARSTDLDLQFPTERLMEKGLFAKASYAVRF